MAEYREGVSFAFVEGWSFWTYVGWAVTAFVAAFVLDSIFGKKLKSGKTEPPTITVILFSASVVLLAAGILFLPYKWIFNPKPNMNELRQDLRDAIRAQEIYHESGGANSGMVDAWNDQLSDLRERHSAGLISTRDYLDESKFIKEQI